MSVLESVRKGLVLPDEHGHLHSAKEVAASIQARPKQHPEK